MLKLLYKTLLISLLSCSLMVIDFNSKGLTFNNVQAETMKLDSAKDSDIMATLTMAGVGLLTSRLWSCPTKSIDMYIAAAGGAAFVAGEILSTIKLRKVMKDLEQEIIRDSKTGRVNEAQIDSLKKLKESYEQAKKTAGTKKTLQQAAAAAFLAAAAVAYSMDAAFTASEAACQSAIASSGTGCTAEAAAYTASYAYAQAAQSTAGGTGIVASLASMVSGWLDMLSLAPSAALDAKAKAQMAATEAAHATASTQCMAARGGEAACKSTALIKEGGKGVCLSLAVASVPSAFGKTKYAYAMTPVKRPVTFAEIFQSAFIASAHADLFTPMGITSTVAVGYLLETSTTLGLKIDTYLFQPMNRAIIWGVLAGLSYMASSATDNVVRKIDQNIQKIDNILNNMNLMAKGAQGTQTVQNKAAIQTTVKPNSRMEFNSTEYGEIDLNKEGAGSLPCFTAPESGNKCLSFTEATKDLPSFKALNVESQKQINGILSTANGLNGTSKISSGTMNGLVALGSSSAALKSNVDAAKKKLQDRLKAANSKLNIQEREKQLSNDIEKAMRDGLKKRNMSADAMASNMYGGRGGFSSGSSAVADTKAETKEALKAVVPTAKVIDISAGGAAATDAGLTGLDAGAPKELSAEELAKLNADQKAVAGSALDEYDLKNDITNDTSSSIFDLISNRYQKSGYPRLFKIKETQAPAPVTK